jgi:hypothetical protein
MLSENVILGDLVKEEGDNETNSEMSESERASSVGGLDARSNADTTEEREADDDDDSPGAQEATMNAERNASSGKVDGILTEEEREMKAMVDLGTPLILVLRIVMINLMQVDN